MNGPRFLESPALFFDLGRDGWQALHGEDILDIPLQRDETGNITAATRAHLLAAVGEFLKRRGLRAPVRALCAVDARGVSLRRLKLPPAPKEEFQRLLLLQIESEFPLPPDQLAWGSRLLGQVAGRQDVLVAAVRKQWLEPSWEILAACGIRPLFTVAALARNAITPAPAGARAVLDLGPAQSEMLCLEDGFPGSVRVVPWGTGNLAEAHAAGLKLTGGTIYLTGCSAAGATVLEQLSRSLGARCLPLPLAPSSPGALLRGLRASATRESHSPPLLLNANGGNAGAVKVDRKSRQWLAAAAALALAVLLFPFAEALALKPFLARRLTTLKAGGGRLAAIDREVDFLQYLKKNQPPYLDTLYLLAKSAPPGTSFDAVSLARRGEISLHGRLAGAQQVTEFRSKLIDAGWFSTVVVEEQTPTPDRQVNVRITAQLKDADDRSPLADEAPPAAPVKPKPPQ